MGIKNPQREKNMLKAGKLLLNYKFTILFIIYLFFIISIPVNFKAGISLLLHIVPLVLILYVLAKSKFSIIWGILFVFIISINAYFSFVFKSILGLGFVASIIETNVQEATSVLKDAIGAGLLIIVVSAILIFGSIAELKKLKIPRRYPLIVIGLYTFLFLPITCNRVLQASGLKVFVERNPIAVYERLINIHAPILYGNIAVVAAYMNEIYEFEKHKNMERQMPPGIKYVGEANAVEKVYLVIGESSNRKHYSLYGYDVPTTPFLDSLHRTQSSNLTFYEGISPASITRNAVPMILTFATPLDFTLFYKEKTIIDLANLHGYETIWISNQEKLDVSESLTGNYVSQVASSSSQLCFSPVPFSEDFNLVEKMKELYKKDKKQFFIFHLSGSHMSYTDKYDAIDEQAITGPSTDVLDYDRTIHHTDRFLKKVYNVMQNDSSAVLYYVSDHGEVIGKGHGTGRHKVEFEVPLVTVNQSNVSLDSIVNKYIDRQSSLINSGNTIYILSELLGYSISDSIVQAAVERTETLLFDGTETLEFSKVKE